MTKYNTNQRKELLEFLEKNHDRQLNVDEIAQGLMDENISKSAIYRNLATLESEGRVTKLTKPGERDARYLYIDADECRGQIHLSCVKCGKTYHLDSEITDRLSKVTSDLEDFEISKKESILYGVCKNCRDKD